MFAAALPAIATAAGAFLGYKGQQETNAANVGMANRANALSQQSATTANSISEQMFYDNMNNQNWMATHAYQNAVKDMRLAGVNPMLAYTQGGASTGSGSSGSGTYASGQTGAPLRSPVSSALSSAAEAATTMANIRNTLATNDNINAQTNLTKAQAMKVVADTNISKASLNKAETLSHLWSIPNRASTAVAHVANKALDSASSGFSPQGKQFISNAGSKIRNFYSQYGQDSESARQLAQSLGKYGLSLPFSSR